MSHPTEVAEVRTRYGQLAGLRVSPTSDVPTTSEQTQQQGGNPRRSYPAKEGKGDSSGQLSRRSSFEKIELAMQSFHDAYAETEIATISFSQSSSFLCVLLVFADMVLLLGTEHQELRGPWWTGVAGLALSAVATTLLAIMAVPPLSPWKATMTPIAFFSRGTLALFQILQLLAADLPASTASTLLILVPVLPASVCGYLAFRYILIRRQLIEAVHHTHKNIAKV